MPKVSILIPVFNRKEYIAECIQSGLDQTFADFEIVVVDNASTDDTWKVCQQFAAKDQRVRIFRNDTNIGPVRNWLACLAQARGEYTKILWSDDLIHPDFLSKLLPFLEDTSVGFVYSSACAFQHSITETRTRLYTKVATGVHLSSIFIEDALIGEGFPRSPGCALFRTRDVRKNLLLHVPNRVNSDFSMHAIGNDLLLFLLTAAEYPHFAVVNEMLSYFRVHEGSITTSGAASGKIHLHYDLAKGYFAESHLNTSLQKKLNTMFFMHMLKYRTSQFGIKSLDHFFPTINSVGLDWGLLIKRVFQKLK